MSDYQVIARKYRPQRFQEVVGQEAIVTTIKNAIKSKRLAHAYLFCGSRGTGKTTLARLLAKGLNCPHLNANDEPCNQCTSCKEIAAGNSLDILEIDGASNRGIDDIRRINETVGYATATGGHKVYIIDEVHMLTKEAFNALLKTLEEPPAKVLFLFATTEPHKVPPTILSRCQRFNLSRIPLASIVTKLQEICHDLNVEIDEESLRLIAHRSEGGLRDAESLLDQILSFHSGKITIECASAILGVMSRDALFALDQAGKEGNLAIAFEISHQLFSEGKDIIHFVESLTEHFRTILLVKVAGKNAPFLNLSETERDKYEATAKLYSQEQCLTLLDYLVEAQDRIRFHSSTRLVLEAILLKILRSHQRVPVEFLVKKLMELEKVVGGKPVESISIDPTPSPADLGIKPKAVPAPQPKVAATSEVQPKPAPAPQPKVAPAPQPKAAAAPEIKPKTAPPKLENQGKYDTLMQFAAVELEGTVKKPHI